MCQTNMKRVFIIIISFIIKIAISDQLGEDTFFVRISKNPRNQGNSRTDINEKIVLVLSELQRNMAQKVKQAEVEKLSLAYFQLRKWILKMAFALTLEPVAFRE